MADYRNVFGSGNHSGNGTPPPSGIDGFDAARPAPEYTPLPPGVYRCRVIKGEFATTRAGDDAYKVQFAVAEGEHTGRTVIRIWTFGAKAIGYTRRDLAVFGLTTSAQLLSPFPPAGRECYCRVVVALRRDNDGTDRNDVKKIDEVRFVDSAAAAFMIDDRAEGGTP